MAHVPPEVLESPEIAAERIKLAADKVHAATAQLFEGGDREWFLPDVLDTNLDPRHQIAFMNRVTEYDFHIAEDYRVIRAGRGRDNTSSFWIEYQNDTARVPKEKWLVTDSGELRRTGFKVDLIQVLQTRGVIELRAEAGKPMLEIFNVELAHDRLAEFTASLEEPTLPQQAEKAEAFAQRYDNAVKRVFIDPRLVKSPEPATRG